MTNTAATSNHFTTLQAGRAIAALLVVFYHNGIGIFALDKYWGNDPTNGLFIFAHAGVNFFFVLSGFVIYYIHNKDIGTPSRLANFAKKRFVRIYPIYWLILFCIIPIYFIVPSFGHDYHRAPATIISSFILVYFDENLHSELGVAWTLYHEIFFYCLFALAICHKRLGLAAISLWFASCIAYFFFAPSGFPLNFVAMPINLLFGMGMLTCHLFQKQIIPVPSLLIFAGIAIFLGAACDENYYQFFSGHSRNIIYGIGSMFALMGLVERERMGHLRAPVLLQKIGDASYSIYLTHFTILSFTAKIFIAAGANTALPIMLSFVMLPIIAVSIGMLIHRHVERPLLKKCNQWVFKK